MKKLLIVMPFAWLWIATGKTEDEAIVNWAKKYGVKLWNEE